jgi:hypothetical protein
MKVRITQLDGRLPNLALMRISAYHRKLGDEVFFSRQAAPDLLEPDYDRVYGSAIFKFSDKKITRFKEAFPNAVLGGTGTFSPITVEALVSDFEEYDYSIYPKFDASLGFTQRGCRLSCKFCVVPEKEGKNKSVHTIDEIWRGEPYPKHLHLLDNDFFGQEFWHERSREIIDGGFKVCFNQGLNVRLITEEGSELLSQMNYYDDQFKVRRIYTAFDNQKDKKIFFRGVDILEKAGIDPRHLLVYMLIGYAKGETMDDVIWRFNEIKQRGSFPFPMVYDRSRRDLRDFARWAIRGIHNVCSFDEYRSGIKKQDKSLGDFFDEYDDGNEDFPTTIPSEVPS